MKLLANGCSMTHGQELVTDGYDMRNTQLCYAKKIYDEFDDIFDEYDNVALPGVSNAHIVESTMDYLITQGGDNTFVLIGWTSPIRYCFTHNERYLRFNIHNPPSEGDWEAGPNICDFHEQFRIHMNDPHDLARQFFHQVNYLSTYLEYAGIPYAMSYFFEEPGYSQSRRRLITNHWPKNANTKLEFGTPQPNWLYKHNILPGAHWNFLNTQAKEHGNLWCSNRHPNELGHELIAERIMPLVSKHLGTT
tara:strand:+ start:372 stop:1118 length:747 start_codon:yes stop_codon:yes gene_type:complete